ncbi:MAG: hypothetical protein VYC39_07720 [Myxococcota bacterium]|nr:hypothetical protein [Myxococcota bacterium]
MEQTDREITALARAIAAREVVRNRSILADTYEDLVEQVRSQIVDGDPLENYTRESTEGAYLVGRYVLNFIYKNEGEEFLEEPRTRSEVFEILGQSADLAWAKVLMRDWSELETDETIPTQSLSCATLSGLSELSLSKSEVSSALNQLRVADRSLNQLVILRRTLRDVCAIIDLLPDADEHLGTGYILVMAAMALRAPERALELVQQVPPDADLGSVLRELARCASLLQRGERVDLARDEDLPVLDYELAIASEETNPADADEPLSDLAEDDYDEPIMEIVEQIVVPDEVRATPSAPLVRPPTWPGANGLAVEVDETTLRLWFEGRATRKGACAVNGSILGLKPKYESRDFLQIPPSMTVIIEAMEYSSSPPDPSTAETERVDIAAFMASEKERLGLSSIRPLYPVVRTCLRVLAQAPEGEIPNSRMMTLSGDAHGYLARARRLGLLVEGALEKSQEVLGALNLQNDLERRVEIIAKQRYSSVNVLTPSNHFLSKEEARKVCANIVFELCENFGRTVAGTS